MGNLEDTFNKLFAASEEKFCEGETEKNEKCVRDLLRLEDGNLNISRNTLSFLYKWVNYGWGDENADIDRITYIWNRVFDSRVRISSHKYAWRVADACHPGRISSFTVNLKKVKEFQEHRPNSDIVIQKDLLNPDVKFYPLCDAIQTLRKMPSAPFIVNELLEKAEAEQEYVIEE